MDSASFESLFSKVEAAVDAHPKIRRAPGRDAEITFSRSGATVRIMVLFPRKQKAVEIREFKETAEAAVDALLENLDLWVEVWK
jgi:hypothetical protein